MTRSKMDIIMRLQFYCSKETAVSAITFIETIIRLSSLCACHIQLSSNG
jgi:hypothetical protein